MPALAQRRFLSRLELAGEVRWNPMNENPYQSPQADTAREARRNPKTITTRIGTAILVLGLVALAYGAFTFWVMPSLPPNTAWSGRLPSLYCMGAGIFVTLIGLTLNSIQSSTNKGATVPTSLGILVLVAIVIAFFFVVSRL
jgi:hypothetical protein